MATLGKDPKNWELEDLVAAHFTSRGCYVETGVTERSPEDILELDIVWTDYRNEPPRGRPVEVKSGGWGLGEVFKFFGWTRYLGLEPGEFVFREAWAKADACLEHVKKGTGINFLYLPTPADATAHFNSLGLPDPHWEGLPDLWRFSFWAQRRLLTSLNQAVKQNVCPESAKTAKHYQKLINDAVFFIPDVRDRVGELLTAHLGHQELGASAAYELATGKVQFDGAPQTPIFNRALYDGTHFPIQACLYLAHRARLNILKAVIDYWLARERGDIPKTRIKLGDTLYDLTAGRLSQAMAEGIDELSSAKSFRMFPVFWQVFLWSWGGFLLKDRLDQEYADLEKETGVPLEEISVALSAFDKFFPTPGGWFREPGNDSRRVLMLMPAAMRGIGALRRRVRLGVKEYSEMGYTNYTASRLNSDHNSGARLLNSADIELTK
jgi:hypothetical protein